MSKELKLKPINKLSTFVNTIYDNFFHELINLEDELKNENEPLHYLILKTKIEATKNALKMYEAVVDEATEYIEVDENE